MKQNPKLLKDLAEKINAALPPALVKGRENLVKLQKNLAAAKEALERAKETFLAARRSQQPHSARLDLVVDSTRKPVAGAKTAARIPSIATAQAELESAEREVGELVATVDAQADANDRMVTVASGEVSRALRVEYLDVVRRVVAGMRVMHDAVRDEATVADAFDLAGLRFPGRLIVPSALHNCDVDDPDGGAATEFAKECKAAGVRA